MVHKDPENRRQLFVKLPEILKKRKGGSLIFELMRLDYLVIPSEGQVK